jgi:hypothetical protein
MYNRSAPPVGRNNKTEYVADGLHERTIEIFVIAKLDINCARGTNRRMHPFYGSIYVWVCFGTAETLPGLKVAQ